MQNQMILVSEMVEFRESDCDNGESAYGNISIRSELLANLNDNCIPTDIVAMEHTDYLCFLDKRRKMMAKKIQNYYNNL